MVTPIYEDTHTRTHTHTRAHTRTHAHTRAHTHTGHIMTVNANSIYLQLTQSLLELSSQKISPCFQRTNERKFCSAVAL